MVSPSGQPAVAARGVTGTAAGKTHVAAAATMSPTSEQLQREGVMALTSPPNQHSAAGGGFSAAHALSPQQQQQGPATGPLSPLSRMALGGDAALEELAGWIALNGLPAELTDGSLWVFPPNASPPRPAESPATGAADGALRGSGSAAARGSPAGTGSGAQAGKDGGAGQPRRSSTWSPSALIM
jgi:hypothetical protein